MGNNMQKTLTDRFFDFGLIIAVGDSARCPLGGLGTRTFIKSFLWVVHPHLSFRTDSCSTHPDYRQSRGLICTSFQRLRRRLLEDYEAGDRGKVASPTRHILRRRGVAAGSIVVGHGRRDWPRGGAAMKIDVWWLLLLEGRVGAVPYATAVPPCQPAPARDKDGVCYARALI